MDLLKITSEFSDINMHILIALIEIKSAFSGICY